MRMRVVCMLFSLKVLLFIPHSRHVTYAKYLYINDYYFVIILTKFPF